MEEGDFIAKWEEKKANLLEEILHYEHELNPLKELLSNTPIT